MYSPLNGASWRRPRHEDKYLEKLELEILLDARVAMTYIGSKERGGLLLDVRGKTSTNTNGKFFLGFFPIKV